MAAINDVVDLTVDAGLAVVTLDSPPVNALSGRLMDGMSRALVQAMDDPGVEVILLICAGRTFIAGADINDLGSGDVFFALQSRMENATKPMVAAIHGSCLGGGMEIALTCSYRVAVPSARFGLPEVNLGLLPGGGGTQRLPRVVGVGAALDLLVTGRQLGATEALELGLVDALLDRGDQQGGGVAFARALMKLGGPVPRVRDRADRIGEWTPRTFADARARMSRERVGEDAPLAIIRCVEAAVAGDFDAGIAIERMEFDRIVDGAQSAALRHVFFAERQAAKIPDLPKDIVSASLQGLCLIGDRAEALAPLFTGRGLAPASVPDNSCAFVLLALTGNVAEQQSRLAATLAAHPTAIIAIDAPGIPLDALLDGLPGTHAVIGVQIDTAGSGSRVVEIVRGAATGPVAVATALALARKLGIVGIVSSGGGLAIGTRLGQAARDAFETGLASGVDPIVIAHAAADYGFGPSLFGSLGIPHPEPGAGDTAILDGLLSGITAEASRIMAEGVAIRPSDVDMAAILALGWPSRTGGPLFQAGGQ